MEIKKSGPMTPAEINAIQAEVRPPVVFEAFNQMIALHWDGQRASVLQKDVVKLLRELDPAMTDQKIRDEHLLDVEPAYRLAGWKVRYDKPGWNESGSAFFVFTTGD